MAVKRLEVSHMSMMLSYTGIFSVVLILFDVLGAPGASGWSGDLVIAFMASSMLTWIRFRKTDKTDPHPVRIAIVVVAIALWLAISVRTFPWVPYDDGTLSLGFIVLVIFVGPELFKTARHRLSARGR